MTVPTPDDLAAWLDSLPGIRVLIVGDIMLDAFVSGEVARVSPEAPVPVLRVAERQEMLGGAGNVLRNLAELGAQAKLVGAVGDDEAGRRVRQLAGNADDDGSGLVTASDRPTTSKTRYLAQGQQLLRSDTETAAPLRDDQASAILKAVTAALPACDALILSDYGKGVLHPDTTRKVIALARAAGRPVIVDPKGRDYSAYAGAGVVTPNRSELREATGENADSDAAVAAAAGRLREQVGLDAVLATRGPAGMTLVTAAETPLHLPAATRDVFDVSGAGDTVVATLGAALGAGAPLPTAAGLANVAAGLVVGKVGTATVRPEEILHALHANRLRASERKVLDTASAAERVAAWRRAGQRVGFTNGCFDLLHPGHVSLLRQARTQCDRLIVGLNSDASVTRLKGPERPIQDAAARAAVLASLGDVDAVVIFGEDTPLSLIETLRPDTLVKGGDYTPESVVGADVVTSHGGRVVIADLEPGHATSATVRRLRD